MSIGLTQEEYELELLWAMREAEQQTIERIVQIIDTAPQTTPKAYMEVLEGLPSAYTEDE